MDSKKRSWAERRAGKARRLARVAPYVDGK